MEILYLLYANHVGKFELQLSYESNNELLSRPNTYWLYLPANALEINCVKYQRDCQAKLKSLKSLHKIVVQLNCWKIYCKVNQLLHHLSYFQLNVNSQVILYSGRDLICFQYKYIGLSRKFTSGCRFRWSSHPKINCS